MVGFGDADAAQRAVFASCWFGEATAAAEDIGAVEDVVVGVGVDVGGVGLGGYVVGGFCYAQVGEEVGEG